MLLDEHGEKVYKVMIAVPCGDLVHAQFAQDLALLMGYTTLVRPQMEVHLAFLRGTYLPRARAGLVKWAEERQATHILWLDADMRFPKDALLRLIQRDKAIVGANYPTRTSPIIPTATDTNRDPIFGGDGLMEATMMGFGCLLTDIEVFRAIGKPYFALGYSPAMDDYSGEDHFFCEKARKAGYQLLVDAGLSEEVIHLGTFPFGMPHARMTLTAAVEQEKV